MPAFDVAGARKAGYDDKEILSYVAGEENPDLIPGTDAEKIRLLLARNGKHMLDVEYLSPTQLEPMQEVQFQDWAKKNKVRLEPGWNEDYDMRGLWKATPDAVPDARGGWPDTYKLPNHPTFSSQSIYALPELPAPKLPQGLSGPPASVPGSVPQTGERRNLTPQEQDALWSEQGIQPTLPPSSLLDMAMLATSGPAQDAGIPLSLIGMVKGSGKSSAITNALEELAEKFPVNPANPAERVLIAQGKPVGTFQVEQVGDRLRLRTMQSSEPRSGVGSLMLDRILKTADKHGVPVELTASPYGPEAGGRIGKDKLVNWYESRGFQQEPGYDPAFGYMVREPATLSDLTKNRMKSALPPLTDNYLKPLSEYTPTLYRETNMPGVMDFLEHNVNPPTVLHGSNLRDLALGQGGNKGVMVEFDSKGLQGQVNTRKPSWEMSYGKGEAEFEIKNPTSEALQESVRSITVKPEALQGREGKTWGTRFKNTMKQQGWKPQANPDGSTTYIKPTKE